MKTIISQAPGRTCLFGDHQDYLGLPVIACAINRHITLTAVENGIRILNINKPDIQEKRVISIDEIIDVVEKGDHFLSALRVLRRHGCIPDKGYDITIEGNIPINAGISSSSAVMVSWVQFLLEAFGANTTITSEFIAQMAYEAEVLEHGAPGGKMDQYSIGLGNIIFLETGDHFSYKVIDKPLHAIIIGESGIPKETLGLLSHVKDNALLAIKAVTKKINGFNIQNAKKDDLNKYLTYVKDDLQPYLYAAIVNHDITQKALVEFNEEYPDLKKIGSLMTEHHQILKDTLKITVPRIDDMIDAALRAGALGAKIVGSGGGGSIVAIAPLGYERQIIKSMMNAGAKDSYLVTVDPGARIIPIMT